MRMTILRGQGYQIFDIEYQKSDTLRNQSKEKLLINKAIRANFNGLDSWYKHCFIYLIVLFMVILNV